MKIVFDVKKNEVRCEVTSNKYPIVNYLIPFNINMQDNCDAKLLAHHLSIGFGDTVAKIRREEYEAGYKAGRQHRRKQRWFSRLLGD